MGCQTESGPIYYNNLLQALKETATGQFDRRKAVELAKRTGNRSSALSDALGR